MGSLGDEVAAARLRLAGLVFACPFCEADPLCPVEPLRKMALKERVAAARNLPDEVVLDMMAHHTACVARRERWMDKNWRCAEG